MATCLAIGDIHIQPNNISEVEIFISNLKKYLDSNKFDFIVALGDTLHFHEKLDSLSLSKATEYFEVLASYAPLYVLVGNHDFISNNQLLTKNHWLNPFKSSKLNITIVDSVVCKTINGLNFIFTPYMPDSKFKETLEQNLGNEWWKSKKYSGIFCHQLFNNVKMGAITAKDVEDWDIPVQIISGHIHDKQTHPNLYYTGSSLQHQYGESSDKTVAICSFLSNGTNKIKELDLHPPKKKLLYCDSKDEIDEKLNPYLGEMKENGLKVKLSISGNYEEFKEFKKTKKFKELKSKGILVDFKREKIVSSKKKKKQDSSLPIVKNSNFFELLDKTVNKYASKNESKELLDFYRSMMN